ncbi:MAG: GH92 family glycosyl hydrolase [Dysgonomonas sp.]|nr:GH92 family glycosyl hydrolase [Dysgonomonas sp.]
MLRKKELFIIVFLSVCLICIKSYSQTNYAKLVDTRIGTEGNGLGCGYTFIGATYPFGMMQFTPSFFSSHKGFVVNQYSGAGCPHMGNFPVLPLSGELKDSPEDMDKFEKYKEVNNSYAGYFSATMNDEVICNTTVAERSGIAEFIFPKSQEKGTVIIGSGVSSTFLYNAHIKITSNNSCEGFAEGGEMCGYATKYRIYFVAEFNRNASKTGTWTGNDLRENRTTIGGEKSGAYFVFDLKNNNKVEYKIAISYVSVENARENLKKDNNNRDFATVKEDTENVWNQHLSKIAVESTSTDRIKQFYTNFYHAIIHPSIFSDINGEYIGADHKIHKAEMGRKFYTGFSGWDTYRTQCQFLVMLYPKESSDMAQSAVEFAEQAGGYGRWVLANIETGIMHGDPMPIIIANTWVYGGKNFDVQKAYKYMKKGATVVGTYSQNQIVRPGLENYIEKGIENASLCLEYASSDYAIGQFALQALGNEVDANFFINRAQNWKNLYDPDTRWLCSRHNHDMSWKHPDHDWREATKENYFWMVPFNLKGLIDTLGGKQVASARLDSLFVRLDASYDEHHFAAGNEPDFQVPWIYNWTDKPYKTSEVIYRIFDEMYTSAPTGLPGNDDLGAMGAWYVFASIGLYPMIPGVAGFSINAPQFEKISIHFPEGICEIVGGNTEMSYIQNVKINNKIWNSTWIDWKTIQKGGVIKYTLKEKPNKKWGLK